MQQYRTRYGARLVTFHHLNGIQDTRGTADVHSPAPAALQRPYLYVVPTPPRREHSHPFLRIVAWLLALWLFVLAVQFGLLLQLEHAAASASEVSR